MPAACTVTTPCTAVQMQTRMNYTYLIISLC